MAVATGTQIRPELSAVNYAPFLQAASQSAQMQAQGIAALGAGVTKGFESFVQQQKENKQLEAEVKSAERLGNSLQFFLKDINPEAQAEFGKLMGGISDPNLSLRERAANSKNLGAALNSIIGLAQQGKKVQDEKAAAQYAGMLRMGGGQIPSPISGAALSGFTDQQKLLGEELYLRGAKTKADIQETQAKTLALGRPKVQDLSFEEQAYAQAVAAKQEQLGRPLTAQEKADLYSQVGQMRRPQTNVTVGEGSASKVFSDLRGLQSNITSLREVSSLYDDAINEITQEKAFSGPTGAIKYFGAKAAQMFGSNQFKNEADAYQSAASALAGSVLAIARQLPGASSDKDVIFLERVAKGDERVPSAEAIKKLKDRVERKIARLQADLSADVSAFGKAAKGDKNIEFLHNILTARDQAPVTSGGKSDSDIFNQADAIISR